jgi:hypothetical protein
MLMFDSPKHKMYVYYLKQNTDECKYFKSAFPLSTQQT